MIENNNETVSNEFKIRFFSKVKKTDKCWNWTASSRGNGYGAIKINGKVIDAHRASWKIHFGEITDGLYVCHKCDNGMCVNPEHLFLGSHSENMKDAYKKQRISPPTIGRFKDGHKPSNRTIKNESELMIIKNKITNRTGSLKSLAQEINLPEQLLKDISCGRVY
jgi:hypothetical protein